MSPSNLVLGFCRIKCSQIGLQFVLVFFSTMKLGLGVQIRLAYIHLAGIYGAEAADKS